MAYLQYSNPFIALNPNLNVNYTLVWNDYHWMIVEAQKPHVNWK